MANHRSTDKYTPDEFERATTPGGSWRHPAQPLPRIGEYTLLRELGRGSFGVVYQAKREGLERFFALKLLLSDDPEIIARFHVEAQAAGKINDPGIVGVLDVGFAGERPYYVMDYCEGPTLEERLRHGPIIEHEAAELVRDLAHTLAKVHARGVIHRDLKPENILMDEASGRARITDFGLARDFSVAGVTRAGDTVGTPYYMAPEQLHSAKDVDERADVYALGVILYRCLTGELPYPGATITEVYERIQRGRFPRPRQVVPTLSPEIEAICLAAMEGDRSARTQSAADFAAALDRYTGGSTLGSGWQRPAGNWLTVIGLTAAALLIGSALTLWLNQRAQRGRFAEARGQLELAKSRRAAGGEVKVPLERAERLGEGDDELLAEVAALRQALVRDQALSELGGLLLGGGSAEAVDEILAAHADDPAFAASARTLTEEILARAVRELDTGQASAVQKLDRSLEIAARLPGADDRLRRALQVAQLLGRARVETGENLARARDYVDQARRAARRDKGLLELISAESRRIEAREHLNDARQLAFQLGEADPILRRLDRARVLGEADRSFLAEVELARATVLYRRGRYAEAARLTASLTDPDGSAGRHARYVGGMSLLRQGREAESRVVFEQLVPGEDALAHLARAALSLNFDGRPQAGLRDAQRALELDPSLVDAKITLAVSQANVDLAGGRALAEEALKEAPDHPRAHVVLGLMRERAQDLVGANESYSRAIALTGGALSAALAFRGRISLERGQARRALADLERALKIEQRPSYLVLRGRAFFALQQPAKAQKDWLEVVAREPETLRGEIARVASPEVRKAMRVALSGGTVNSGPDVLDAVREWQRAQTPLREALAQLEGRLEQVEHCYRRGRFVEVVSRTEDLGDTPREVQLRMLEMRAYSLYFVDRVGECVGLLEQIYRSDPRGAIGLTSGGAYHVFRGRVREAERLLSEALRVSPRRVDALIDQGFLYLAAQESSRARDSVELALREAPGHARALYCYSAISQVRNDLARALEAAELLTRSSGEQPLERFARDQANLALRVPDADAQRRAVAALTASIERHTPALRARLQIVPILRGLLLRRLGKPDEAAADWRAAHKANPQTFERLIQGLDPISLEAVRSALRQE